MADQGGGKIKVKVNYQKVDREVEVDGTATVLQLKEAIYALTQVPVALQKLLKSGLQLKDDAATLDKVKVGNNSKLLLIGNDIQVRFCPPYTPTTPLLHPYYTPTTPLLHTYYTPTTHLLHTYYTPTTPQYTPTTPFGWSIPCFTD